MAGFSGIASLVCLSVGLMMVAMNGKVEAGHRLCKLCGASSQDPISRQSSHTPYTQQVKRSLKEENAGTSCLECFQSQAKERDNLNYEMDWASNDPGDQDAEPAVGYETPQPADTKFSRSVSDASIKPPPTPDWMKKNKASGRYSRSDSDASIKPPPTPDWLKKNKACSSSAEVRHARDQCLASIVSGSTSGAGDPYAIRRTPDGSIPRSGRDTAGSSIRESEASSEIHTVHSSEASP